MGNSPKTVGLEFESIIAEREGVSRAFNIGDSSTIRTVTRDASVESEMALIGGSSSLFLGSSFLRDRFRSKSKLVTGYEIVTFPLEMDEMRKTIIRVLNAQSKTGEIFSDRSSIHVHVGFPSGFIFLKSALALGIKVEPLLYKIAGMGGTYRGIINNSAYCRALMAPPAVRLADLDNEFAILDPASALETGNVTDFWAKFGIRYGDRERYNPLRYMGINLYSTILKGTLEFRFFNFSLVSKHVEAVAALSQFLVDLMIRLPIHESSALPHIDIFKENDDETYLRLLEELVTLGRYYGCEFNLYSRDIDSIAELIFTTKQPVFVNKPILSHVNSARITSVDAKRSGLRIIKEASPPGIIDIHNFANIDVSLLGDACKCAN